VCSSDLKYLNKEELQHSLNIKDLSDNTNGIHSINLILDQIKLNLKSKYQLYVKIHKGTKGYVNI